MNKTKKITRDDVVEVLRRFKKTSADKYHIIQLGLFGSLARGTGSDKSDVDIVVELSKPDLLILIGIKQDLEEELNQHVDIIRYREKMNPFLKKRIDNEAVYV